MTNVRAVKGCFHESFDMIANMRRVDLVARSDSGRLALRQSGKRHQTKLGVLKVDEGDDE